jgi:hypothetical protein
VGSRGTSGIVTDDLETFRQENLESEVDGGASEAPYMGGIRKNGSNRISNLYRVTLLDCHTASYFKGTRGLSGRGAAFISHLPPVLRLRMGGVIHLPP